MHIRHSMLDSIFNEPFNVQWGIQSSMHIQWTISCSIHNYSIDIRTRDLQTKNSALICQFANRLRSYGTKFREVGMGSECRSFDVKELPLLLNAVLKKAQCISHNALEAHIVVLDGTLSLSREMAALMQIIWNDSICCPRFLKRSFLQWTTTNKIVIFYCNNGCKKFPFHYCKFFPRKNKVSNPIRGSWRSLQFVNCDHLQWDIFPRLHCQLPISASLLDAVTSKSPWSAIFSTVMLQFSLSVLFSWGQTQKPCSPLRFSVVCFVKDWLTMMTKLSGTLFD